MTRISDLRAKIDAMTAAPWWVSADDGMICSGEEGPDAIEVGNVDMRDADVLGIIELRSLAPRLLEIVELADRYRSAEEEYGKARGEFLLYYPGAAETARQRHAEVSEIRRKLDVALAELKGPAAPKAPA